MQLIDKDAAQTPVNEISEAMDQIVSDGITDLRVIPAILVPGKKMNMIREKLAPYQEKFASFQIDLPLLEREGIERQIVPALNKILQVDPSKVYILVAHKSDAQLKPLYNKVLLQLRHDCLNNVHFLFVEGIPGADSIIDLCLAEYEHMSVILCPFMLINSLHVSRDITEGDHAVAKQFSEAGLTIEKILPALGEYQEFRKLFY